MSALPLKADVLSVETNVRYVPIADIFVGTRQRPGELPKRIWAACPVSASIKASRSF